MADQNLKVNLDADAQPLIEALATADEHLNNISEKADSANKSLESMEAAGELAAEGHRANGGKTERPMDWAAALEEIG